MSDPHRRDLEDVDIDPEVALAAEDPADRTRDSGADLDQQGVPADDLTARGSNAPDPETPAAPTDVPVGSVAPGVTAPEQAEGESLDTNLAREEPDRPAAEEPGDGSPADELADAGEDPAAPR